MITIDLNSEDLKDEHAQSFEFRVDGKRCITVSINHKNLSVQIPGEVNPMSIANSDASFFLRTSDRPKKEKDPISDPAASWV